MREGLEDIWKLIIGNYFTPTVNSIVIMIVIFITQFHQPSFSKYKKNKVFNSQAYNVKGTVRAISSDPSNKDDNTRFTTVPLKALFGKFGKQFFFQLWVSYKSDMRIYSAGRLFKNF